MFGVKGALSYFKQLPLNSNHMSLSNQKCKIQPTLINLHTNKCSQELHYYPFAFKLNRCVRSCNTLNKLSNKVSAPNVTRFKYICFSYDYRKK